MAKAESDHNLPVAELRKLKASPVIRAQLRNLASSPVMQALAADLERLRHRKAAAPARKTRKPGGGRRLKFTPAQQSWLQKRFSRDLRTTPLLAKHEAAVPHVQELAKRKYKIVVSRNTVLSLIVRPVLRPAYFWYQK